MRARRATLLTLAVFALAAPGARALTFGADLSVDANSSGTCATMGAGSCLFYSGAPGPSFYAPASGTVTAVRVKTGPTTGPLQIVVMRSLYQNRAGDPGHPYFACCFVERYGPTFTPNPNTVTAVQTSLPMVVDPTPPPEDTTTNARGDFLALAVLAPDVPIPANADGSSFFSGFAPAPTAPAPSPNPIYPSVTGSGYQILMSADLDPGGGAGGGGGPAVGAPFRPLTIANAGQLLGTTGPPAQAVTRAA